MDYYKILNVAENADSTVIKKQYKLLAVKYHPDKNPNADTNTKFSEIKEAYDILSSPEKRKHYDLQRHPVSMFKWTNLRTDEFTYHKHKIPSITISLNEAYTGISKKLNNTSIIIPKGIRPNTKLQINNTGLIVVHILPHPTFKRANDDLLVDLHITVTEAMTGLAVEVAHLDNTKLSFKVPAGVQHGQVIKLSGKGMANPENNNTGDLLFRCLLAVPKDLTTEQHNAIINICNRRSIKI